jgi:hypothetical protein
MREKRRVVGQPQRGLRISAVRGVAGDQAEFARFSPHATGDRLLFCLLHKTSRLGTGLRRGYSYLSNRSAAMFGFVALECKTRFLAFGGRISRSLPQPTVFWHRGCRALPV